MTTESGPLGLGAKTKKKKTQKKSSDESSSTHLIFFLLFFFFIIPAMAHLDERLYGCGV